MVSSSPDKNDLGTRIAAAQAQQAAKEKPKANTKAATGYGVGMKMVLDLVSGAIVGLVFGIAIDRIFGTEPWGILILITLGLVAGFRLMLRTAESHAKRNAEDSDVGPVEAGNAKQGQKE